MGKVEEREKIVHKRKLHEEKWRKITINESTTLIQERGGLD